MGKSNTVRAICYLERLDDEKNKISLTESSLIIRHRNRSERYDLTHIKNLFFDHRKAMLFLISGGICVPFAALAFYRNFLDPWPTLFLLLGGIFAIYLGWRGYPVLTIQLFGLHRDYKITEVSENLKAFVDFTLKFLPINQSAVNEIDRMIFHITDSPTWHKNKDDTHFRIPTNEKFMHASDRDQIPGTLTKYFKGRTGLLLLTIDPLKVDPEIRYEDLQQEGKLFPHIYGDLNLDAVIKVEEIKPGT